MLKNINFSTKLFNFFALFPLWTSLLFYCLVARVYFWQGFLPFWKHPCAGDYPFETHIDLLDFMLISTVLGAIPVSIIILFYILYYHRSKQLNNYYSYLVAFGFVLFFTMLFIDPYQLFGWYFD